MTKNTNHLPKETSPYLLQHKDNPVHWWPWCDEAFALAKKENKPVLLSIGYAACHWCHVMAHESFEDKEIASLMNKHYVNIKVDREERPDIDAIYQKALQTMGEAGGWPLTMMLTPEGKPFFGGTYFPPKQAHGRPAFKTVLEKIHDVHENQAELVNSNAEKIVAHLQKINTPQASDDNSVSIISAAEKTLEIMDPEHGGTNGAPKFPQTTMLSLLWSAFEITKEEKFKKAALLAVKKMSLGGIYDHIGGGYSRYSTDQFWFAPHFEKMLYDNAYILEMLTILYQNTGDVFWSRRAKETVAWLFDEMKISDGAFASAIDADSEGREGAFYVWQEEEIKTALGKDADLFMKTYGVHKQGNWKEGLHGENILHQLHLEQPLSDAQEGKLKSLKHKLNKTRSKRERPLTDTKILCDWNAMMITSLVGASRVFDEPKWLQQAKVSFSYLTENLKLESGELAHSICDERLGSQALLDDYAHMVRAAIKLYEETGQYDYINKAEIWCAFLFNNFENRQGAYNQSSKNAEALIVKTCDAQDGPTPSGNAVLLECLAKLYHLTYNEIYLEKGQRLYAAFSADVSANPFGYVSLVQAKNLLDNGKLVTVIGSRKDKKTNELLSLVFQNKSLIHIVQPIDNFENLPEKHPAKIKNISIKSFVIICQTGRCSLPIETVADLEKQLKVF